MMQNGTVIVPLLLFFLISFEFPSQVEGIIVLFGLMFKNRYHKLHSINNRNSINVLIGCIEDR